MPQTIPETDLAELERAANFLSNPLLTHDQRMDLLKAIYWSAYASGALQAVKDLRNPLANPKSSH